MLFLGCPFSLYHNLPQNPDRPSRQTCELCFSYALPLQWDPPRTCTEWSKWGSTPQDFASLLPFWTTWTQQCNDSSVRIFTRTHALALFVQHGGACANFLPQCQFVGIVLTSWEFCLLSCLRHTKTRIYAACLDPTMFKKDGLNLSRVKLLSRRFCFFFIPPAVGLNSGLSAAIRIDTRLAETV